MHSIVTKFDIFGADLDNNHNNGIKIYRSILGAILSVFFIVVLATYSAFKYNCLLMYNDSNIMISTQENYYTDHDIFIGGANSFNVAFGLISYDTADQGEDI